MTTIDGKSNDPNRKQPLINRRVLVTRARDQGETLVRALQALGAAVLWIPAIETIAVSPGDSELRVLEHLENFQWIAFTSANAVSYFRDLLAEAGRSIPSQVRIAAVGAATAPGLSA